ncbi:hypothetical protein MBT84_28050 [Streptomyces sp. MBT84]|uniref:hypothetical protein n=1 Tax=Streptomyces sp. MBT84 TaxID=1488414 RepID=UPI001C6F1F51|nr:hypothetical protein [Streptomyces sp. MBT84]MBW8703453.1 hypothetical protein [Streptomyces sp. MBT84]
MSAATWIWGTTETLVPIALLVAGYWFSGRLARRRAAAAQGTVTSSPGDLVQA